MTREQVNEMLKGHHAQVGRCAHLETEIKLLVHDIGRLCAQFQGENPEEAGRTNRSAALAFFMDRERYEGSAEALEIKRMEARLQLLQSELEQRRLKVEFVEAWLKGLTEQERYVVERHIIDHEFWRDVVRRLNDIRPDAVNREKLKRIQTQALSKIYLMAQ